MFRPRSRSKKPVRWQAVGSSRWKAVPEIFQRDQRDQREAKAIPTTQIGDGSTTPVKSGTSFTTPASACLYPESPSRARTSITATRPSRGAANVSGSCRPLVVTDETKSASSPARRDCNDKATKVTPKKSHPVSVVRLMTPIEPAPLAKSTLYIPFAVAGTALLTLSPKRHSSALGPNPENVPKKCTPRKLICSERSVPSPIRSSEVLATNYMLDTSPEAPPRRSLPPCSSNVSRVQEQPWIDNKVVKEGKAENPYSHRDYSPKRLPLPLGVSNIGRKAASVADLRKLFDRPPPSNMSTLSVPKLPPRKNDGDGAFAETTASQHKQDLTAVKQTRRTNGVDNGADNGAEKGAGTSLTSWHSEYQHEQSGSTQHITHLSDNKEDMRGLQKLSFPNYGDNTRGSETTDGLGAEEISLNGVSRSRLRAFIRGRQGSGSWRRMSSRLQRRFSRDHDLAMGRGSHCDTSSASQQTNDTHGGCTTRLVSPKHYPLTTQRQEYGTKSDGHPTQMPQFNAKHEPRRAWVWGHAHEAKEQTGPMFRDSMATKDSRTSSASSIFRRISKEHAFRSWSWGRQRPKETSISSVSNADVGLQRAHVAVDDRSKLANKIEHASQDADATIITQPEVVAIIDAEADCELQHPRPVRVDDTQQLVSLC